LTDGIGGRRGLEKSPRKRIPRWRSRELVVLGDTAESERGTSPSDFVHPFLGKRRRVKKGKEIRNKKRWEKGQEKLEIRVKT